MSDLLAFIRQILPPQWRGPKTIGLVLILFSPVLLLWNRLRVMGADSLARASANGQVAILEATLTQALNAPVYILEGDRSTVDFQVIIPFGTPDDQVLLLRDLLTRYALAPKRWRISEAPSYAPTPNALQLAWQSGFPQRSASQIRWAVNRGGSYQTTITKNGQVVVDEVMTYQAGVEQAYEATVATDVFRLTVGSLSFTMAGTGLIELWASRNGADNLSLLLDAAAGNTYTWVLDTLATNGTVTASRNGEFEYSMAGYPRPAISPTLFRYGGLATVVNGSFRLRISGGVTGATPALIYDSPFTISDAQQNYNFVLGPLPDNTGAIEALIVKDGEWGYVRATGPGANGGVQGRLTGPNGLDTGWQSMTASAVTHEGQSYSHITNIKSRLDGVDGTFTFQARLTINPAILGSFTFTQGAPVVGFGPTMNLIRLRYRQSDNLCDVGITAPGNWEYQVARPDLFPDAGRQYEQQPPNWNAIAWTDFPGSGTGERVLSAAGRTNYTVLVRVRNKDNVRELYEVPIRCIGGSYGWLRFAEPTGGTINVNAVSFLPYRTLTADLTITTEPGPTPDSVYLRIKSGFGLDNDKHWFWWVGTVPLFDKQSQDNFLYPVAKGQYIEVYRLVCLKTAFINYDDQHPEQGGETYASFQWTASKYSAGHLKHADQVRFYIPQN